MPSLPPAIDLAVHEAGDGELVVVLHDLARSGRAMRDSLKPLSTSGYRVLAPDLRGHGDSPSPAGPWSIDDVSSDVARVIQGAVGPAVVVGIGLGGAAAVALALGHPGLVKGLIVSGVNPRAEDIDAQDRWVRVARALRGRAEEGMALAAEAMSTRPDWRGALPQLDVPALVLAGSRDRATPVALQRELALWSRRCRFEIVDAGHDVLADAPARVVAAVRELSVADEVQAVAA
jgi:3-oxoadipate enol-lactonase